MDETLKVILEILDTKEPKYVGINFLLNFLKDTCDERIIDGRRVKFPIYNMFRQNVINSPQMGNTLETWDRIKETGDVSNAFITAFDWDRTPEGYMFWDKFNDLFRKQYNEAIAKGLKYNSIIPKVVDESTNSQSITIMPSDITLKLVRYLSPLCEHTINKQIDILVDVLRENKCEDEFYSHLRIKPKHPHYEEAFEKFLKGGDLRSIIYWAFNWSSVSEGFSFWSQMSDKVNAAITKELVAHPTTMGEHINPNVDKTTHGNLIMRVEPTNKSTTNPQYRPPYGSRCPTAYDDMFSKRSYQNGYWDGWYDDEYDDWGEYYAYSCKSSIPKEIINMPTNKNYIGIASEVTEPSVIE